MSAPVQNYDPDEDLAVYDAEDVEYFVDTGTFIDCPDCGDGVTIDTAVSDGDEFGCGRRPWSVQIEVESPNP